MTYYALAPDSNVIDEFSERLVPPDYYTSTLSEEDLTVISEEARATASRFGY